MISTGILDEYSKRNSSARIFYKNGKYLYVSGKTAEFSYKRALNLNSDNAVRTVCAKYDALKDKAEATWTYHDRS